MLYGEAARVLTGLSLVGGAIAVVVFQSWLGRLGVSRDVAFGITVVFMSTSAFLGAAQTGSAYVPALAMVLIGLHALAGEDAPSDRRTIVVASFAFAGATLLWFPMVLAVPGAVLSMLILRGDSPRRRRVALAVCLASGLITVATYVPIAALAGVRSVAGLGAWIQQATHNIRGIGGLPRAILGLARSVASMDQLGLVAKRYLLDDPFNPATMSDVVRAGLVRLVLLYACLGVAVLALARHAATRRVLWLLAGTAIPVVTFALNWQGGDLERYLPLFPALFCVVALALMLLARRARVAATVASALAVVAPNVGAISRRRAERECALLSNRLGAVPRVDDAPTVILTPHELDEIATYRNRCPSAALLKARTPPMAFGLVMANNEKAVAWRDTLASRAIRAWNRGGRVDLAAGVRSQSLRGGGSGRRATIHGSTGGDFPSFFEQLDVGAAVGGVDGFVELLPTARTRAVIAQLRRLSTR